MGKHRFIKNKTEKEPSKTNKENNLTFLHLVLHFILFKLNDFYKFYLLYQVTPQMMSYRDKLVEHLKSPRQKNKTKHNYVKVNKNEQKRKNAFNKYDNKTSRIAP